jgi:hypothetical protein
MALPFRNLARAIGSPDDPVATDSTSSWSWVSLLKGVHQKVSDGSFAAAVTGRAESLVALCQSAALQCANYLKQTRTAKVAAAASAASASTDAATAAAGATIANFASGTALFGQRAKRDRVAAAASAAAAAASAASVPTAEQLILPTQVFS